MENINNAKMKPTYTFQTNLSMAILAYFQKFIAVILAIYFAFWYLFPLLRQATTLQNEVLFSFVIIALVVYELILHFGLQDFIEGLFAREFRLTQFFGFVSSFVLIAILGFYSTENLQFANRSSQTVKLIDIDSLQSKKGSEISEISRNFQHQNKLLDSLNVPVLARLQNSAWLYAQTQKDYQQAKQNLITAKDKDLQRIDNEYNKLINEGRRANELKSKALQVSTQKTAYNTAWLGLVVLTFSLYSTLVIAVYSGQKGEVLHGGKNEDASQEVVVKNEVVAQTTTTIQNEITVVVQPATTPTIDISEKYNKEKRLLATQYIIENDFLNKGMKDKDKFSFLQKEFGISWGVYSAIKKQLRQSSQ